MKNIERRTRKKKDTRVKYVGKNFHFKRRIGYIENGMTIPPRINANIAEGCLNTPRYFPYINGNILGNVLMNVPIVINLLLLEIR